jgi:hypothetical protein
MLLVGHCSSAADLKKKPSIHRSELTDALLQGEGPGSPTGAVATPKL